MPDHRRVRIVLECEHELWFRKTSIPDFDDTLWCQRCAEYRKVGPRHLGAGVLHPDYAWSSFKKRQRSGTIYGRCEICSYVTHRNAYHLLENAMASHHVNNHTNSSFKTKGFTLAERLPKNSPPPF